MKKQILYAILLLVAAAFPELIFSQGAGTKPELVMYRYNATATVSPLPAAQNDLLGTVKWNGLTAIGNIQTGAAIQSFTPSPVSPGVLYGNLIFSTNGGVGLKNRMIIKETGLVGIGTDNPAFHLHTVGNTHTSGDFFGRIHFDFDSPTDDAPNTYHDEAYFERKLRGTLSVPTAAGVNNFGGILSLAPGGGAYDHQLFFGQDGIWNRREVGSNATWTGAWEKLLSSADIAGRPNLVARFRPPGPISNSLGDGQIFDNGANVVIGGIPAAPAVAAPAFNAADVLTVGGQTRLNGNVRSTGNATVDGSTTTNSLSVTTTANVGGLATANSLSVTNNATVGGLATANSLSVTNNATVNGNVGIGKVPTSFDLDVAGASNFDGRVKIGAASFPTSTSYELAVGGGIMAEEVMVQLQTWPDYVFEKDYALKPLSEVADFIEKQKHLPGVASAKEVETQGLNLGQMQKTQMEKIEELYLHMIAMEKRVSVLESQNEALSAENKQLRNQIGNRK
ncbi:MAG: hypothetical protein ACKVU2_09220 [Saprospiraceae bacterium]